MQSLGHLGVAAGYVKDNLAELHRLAKLGTIDTITVGTFTKEKRELPAGQTFWHDGSSDPTTLNARQLENCGLERLLAIASAMQGIAEETGINLWVSIADPNPATLGNMTEKLARHGFRRFQINFGCVNDFAHNPSSTVGEDPAYVSTAVYEILKRCHGYPVQLSCKMPFYEDRSLLREVSRRVTWHPTVLEVVSSNTKRVTRRDSHGKFLIDSPTGSAGMGGRELRPYANENIQWWVEALRPNMLPWPKVVGCGGIFNAEHVREKLALGVHRVELCSGVHIFTPRIFQDIHLSLPLPEEEMATGK